MSLRPVVAVAAAVQVAVGVRVALACLLVMAGRVHGAGCHLRPTRGLAAVAAAHARVCAGVSAGVGLCARVSAGAGLCVGVSVGAGLCARLSVGAGLCARVRAGIRACARVRMGAAVRARARIRVGVGSAVRAGRGLAVVAVPVATVAATAADFLVVRVRRIVMTLRRRRAHLAVVRLVVGVGGKCRRGSGEHEQDATYKNGQ